MSNYTVIVDVDKTVANNTHRSPYDYSHADLDSPIEDVIFLVRTLHADPDSTIVFVSGRDDESYDITKAWLGKHVGQWAGDAPLFMRAHGDNRPDSEVKRDIYRGLVKPKLPRVKFVIDDRNSVVNMWREEGLRCLQVADGDF